MRDTILLTVVLFLMMLSGCMDNGENFYDEKYDLDKCAGSDYLAERQCYTSIAFNNNDVGVCEQMPEDTNDRQANKAFCLGFIAYVKDDVSICRNQQNQYYKNTCEYTYRRYMFDSKNADEAKALKETYTKMKENPYQSQQEIETISKQKKYLKTCAKYKDVYDRKGCLTEAAEKTGNLSICNLLEEDGYSEECIRDVGIYARNISICDKLQTQRYKAWCYKDVAAATQNLSICDMIQEDGINHDIDYCYKRVAENTRNSSICDGIKNIEIKDDCYFLTGRWIKESSVCDKIQDETIRDNCYSYL